MHVIYYISLLPQKCILLHFCVVCVLACEIRASNLLLEIAAALI